MTTPYEVRAAAPVPDGLRWEPLARFFAERVPGAGALRSAEMVHGGRSNLTYVLEAEHGRWVLRRPPLGAILPTAHDMSREYRMISALSGTDVPVPRPVVYCDDPAVIGAPFYVMAYVPGVVVREEWPEALGGPEARGRASAALVDVLARLHAVDWRAAGLEAFHRPEPYAERQLRRLRAQWEQSKTQDEPLMQAVWARLAASVPPPQPPTIVHGDYRLNNTILAADDPGRILAVVDWELATIGDPLADLGLMLVYWPQADDPAYRLSAQDRAMRVMTLPGFWRREQVVEEYARRSGRDVSLLDWYYVLGFYKLAVICQGIHARYLAGVTRGEGFDAYGKLVPILARMALETAEGSQLPRLMGRGRGGGGRRG